ncbi:MAG: hypothetical protein D3908_03040, partial [Candidatus Electrothrix sp. AUS4]|nr:hypothetical protein [Candidatus Electrothrix sp. AUS4]
MKVELADSRESRHFHINIIPCSSRSKKEGEPFWRPAMTRLHALTQYAEAKLWVWRDKAAGSDITSAHEAQDMGTDADGCRIFKPLLDHQIHQPAHVRLYTGDWAWKDH